MSQATTDRRAPDGTPLHPHHPGVGCSTSLKRLEGATPEVGGFIIFFPSGRFHDISWRAIKHIEPSKEAAIAYVGRVVEDLNKLSDQGDKTADDDLARTNWVSVTAAVQRCILDFNSKLASAISAKMAEEFGGTSWPPKRRKH